MRRIFFKATGEDAPPAPRRSVIALFLAVCAGTGFALGTEAAAKIFTPAPEAEPLETVVVEGIAANIPGHGTATFDARILVQKAGVAPERLALRDAALKIAVQAGALPIVRQSQDVMEAFGRAVGQLAPQAGLGSLTLENAVLYRTGI
ncbi:hypothetical protein AB9K35_04475 [Leisingera sp. XS_AS12]|uniref:hypothetical protein n=1 Tax=Leisingera sp. XS_AS12 TaxID=3241294 RepID=UPI00351982FF